MSKEAPKLAEPLARELLALAHELADAAGEVSRRWFRTGLDADDKADQSPVTRADREAEEAMRALLRAKAKGHGVIGEEHGAENAGADLVWVLDPIDGTKAFLAGKPLFTTLIGLLWEGRPVLGLIDQPVLRDRWSGAVGHGGRFNGAAARTRACPGVASARLSTTGPQYFTDAGRRAFDGVASRAKLLSYGGDGYQYGLVAGGSLDLVIESGLALHDWAAVVAVVESAGGIATDWSGAPLRLADGKKSSGDVVAAGDARAHAEALALLGLAGP